MAYENINIIQPNFCIAPLVGTYATVDTNNATAYLRIKNDSGGTASSYTFNPNISQNTDIRDLDYVGPRNLSVTPNGCRFFTTESNYSDTITIKCWKLNTTDNRLDLDYTITKVSDSINKFKSKNTTVGRYYTSFSSPTVTGTGYVDLDSTTNISSGMYLFLGPSSNSSNSNAVEEVTVTTVSGNRVFLVNGPKYYYNSDDPVTYYDNIYVCSELGKNGDTTKGTLFTLNAYNGSIIDKDYSGLYSSTNTVGFGLPFFNSLGIIKATELLYVNVDDYSIIRSVRLNNILPDKYNYIDVKDVEFTETSIYKLQHSTVKRDDNGNLSQINWSNYNFQEDSVYRFTDSLTLYTDPIGIIGNNETITLYGIVRDQYGIALANKTVYFEKVSGDSGGSFGDPNGEALTDINGVCSITYTSGWYDQSDFTNVNDSILIKAHTDGSNILTGSVYVYGQINLQLNAKFIVNTDSNPYGVDIIKQISNDFDSEYTFEQISSFSSEYVIKSKACFANPGGNINCGSIPGGVTLIKQLSSFDSELIFEQKSEFTGEMKFEQRGDEEDHVDLSQTYISRHYTYGNTDTAEIAQFRFIIDMDPQPFSVKNNVSTNIWIKMAPYGFSLDKSTLVFKVREVSYAGDTGYVDYSNSPLLTITEFDAGGGLIGLELLFDPSWYFHNNAYVYVYFYVYDQAVPPNKIEYDYWFNIIDDYKAPYIINEYPRRNSSNIAINTDIYFDIIDNEVGVDISTLEVYLNNKHTEFEYTTISGGYHVNLKNYDEFYYTETVEVSVVIKDASHRSNELHDSWRFYCVESIKPCIDIDSFYPKVCDRSIPSRTTHMHFNVYDCGGGIDINSLLWLVNNTKVDYTYRSIIKRIK